MKNARIWIPEGKSVFYTSFRIREAGRPHPRQMKRSTGSTERSSAQRIANQMRNLALEDYFGVPKLREDGPRCGAVVDRYLASSAVRNAREVASDFLRVAAVGCVTIDREHARDIPLTHLSADAMINFRDRGDGASPTSTNSLMRSARSIFSARALEHYRDLVIPACVLEWKSVAYLPDPKNHSFQAIPPETLAVMDKGADMMLRLANWHGVVSRWRAEEFAAPFKSAAAPCPPANEWQNAWACYWLMRLCGLRNSEVMALKWHWFSEHKLMKNFDPKSEPRESCMMIDIIERRDEFRPKGTSGSVPIDGGLYGLLVEQFGPYRDGAHVLLGTKTDRENGCLRRVNDFVRRYLPDREKGAYELRKQFGSEMAARHGIETAAKLLRHKSIKTAWEHYYDSLKLSGVKPLSRL